MQPKSRIIEIRKAAIKTANTEIWVDDEGMLCIWLSKDTELDLQEVKDCFEVYKNLGFGPDKKVLQIMDGRNDFTITKEARNFVAENGKKVFFASAVISNNLSMRLVLNFYNSFYDHGVPFRMFGTEKKAREWLRKFKV